MTQKEIINTFISLADDIKNNINNEEYQNIINKAEQKNPWFIKQNIEIALKNITLWFEKTTINEFVKQYTFNENQKTVAIISAGNIPMVAFHDIFCVLVSGNKPLVKLSSNDDVMIPFIIKRMQAINDKIDVMFVDKIKDFDAVIATGSNNTARYFEQYFAKYPHIIRKNRSSVAVIQKDDKINELKDDLLLYYGMGCRNVSTLFIPQDYDINCLVNELQQLENMLDNNKYKNNYDYNKAIFIMNNIPYIDAKSVLLRENNDLYSPISVINYTYYKDINQLYSYLKSKKEELQCVVSSKKDDQLPIVEIGQAQKPRINDYADGVDTMKFLEKL